MTTRRDFLARLLAATSLLVTAGAAAQAPQKITLNQMERMFKNLRARTNWNVNGPLLWGYVFLDPSREKLQHLADELQASGYRVVDLSQAKDTPNFKLQVEKAETHSASTLDALNQKFYALAEKHSVATYDGMDVGPVPSPAK